MTADQAALHEQLFGGVDLEVSAPALVRDGRLAPYQELAYLSRPTPAEAEYIPPKRSVSRSCAPACSTRASPAPRSWNGYRPGWWTGESRRRGAGVWPRFARDEPPWPTPPSGYTPPGCCPARRSQGERAAPAPADGRGLGRAHRRLLPAVPAGQRGRAAMSAPTGPSAGSSRGRVPADPAGVRAGNSPVDRVLARSASKARADRDPGRGIGRAGIRLRALVLCDLEEASGTLAADLAGVLVGSGGAQLVLETLLADPGAAGLDPVLMTGAAWPAARTPRTSSRQWLRRAAPRRHRRPAGPGAGPGRQPPRAAGTRAASSRS